MKKKIIKITGVLLAMTIVAVLYCYFHPGIEKTHPRIWVTTGELSRIKNTMNDDDLQRLLSGKKAGLLDNAFLYLLTGDSKYLDIVRETLEIKDLDNPNYLSDAAVAYDWCYSGFTKEERKVIVDKLADKAKKIMLNKRNFRSFHNIMYENTTAIGLVGLALYGEHPEARKYIRFAGNEYKDALKVLNRIFYDGGWPEGFVYSRHVNLAACKYLLAVESATGKDILEKSPHFKNLAYFMMYGSFPDGTVNNFSDNDYPFLKRHEKLLFNMLIWKYREGDALSYYNGRMQQLPDTYIFQNILWPVEDIKPKPVKELPKAKLFNGTGIIFAHSGWKDEDTFFSFKCSDYYGDHCHYDAGSFTIWREGPIAIDSGIYDDREWSFKDISKSHLFNYYQRTIAHNCILIEDPDEKFEGYEKAPLVNDGGQKVLLWNTKGEGHAPAEYSQKDFGQDRAWKFDKGAWDVSEITAFTSNDRYVYSEGDCSSSYKNSKVKKIKRQVIYAYPDTFITYDKVKTSKRGMVKKWVLHTEAPPICKGNYFTIDTGKGVLEGKVVSPGNFDLKVIGGRGKEFYVGGRNYESLPGKTATKGETPGAWRLEVVSKEKSLEDEFLIVMKLSEPGDLGRTRIVSGKSTKRFIVKIERGKDFTEVMFNRKASGGKIKIIEGGKIVVKEKLSEW